MRFHGYLTKWLQFYDLFRNSIRKNPGPKRVDPFLYLRSLIDGFASKAIVGILTTDIYDDAVSILKKWFGDVRVIERKHIEKLCTVRLVTISASTSGLRNLYDSAQVNIRGLEDLIVSESCYSYMLCNLLRKSI
ncbi:hypothetical protein HPB51_026658 [Rhipicephalus microplus]|uniref:Tick transposon n=1 Tax=Rhipicephalus microplus TaxID=6941 RepID=A0A9J6D2J7_RHIMP|nr:hypothetical protein HPB51_026658 [Rhipicephalus microplus]